MHVSCVRAYIICIYVCPKPYSNIYDSYKFCLGKSNLGLMYIQLFIELNKEKRKGENGVREVNERNNERERERERACLCMCMCLNKFFMYDYETKLLMVFFPNCSPLLHAKMPDTV